MHRPTATDLRRLLLTGIGAFGLAALCVTSAMVPAYGQAPATPLNVTPLTVAEWQADVGTRLDAALRLPPAGMTGRDHLLAVVAVSFDAAGAFADARIARSSGSVAVDDHVVHAARGLRYLPLPAAFRGAARTVVMQAYFGRAAPRTALPLA